MMTTQTPQQVFMIGGPNGAGKTTSAFTLMPELIHCSEYINADAIAASLSPFRPDLLAIKAGRLMLARIKELADKNHNFAFEATMASRNFLSLLTNCKAKGYQTTLLFIWLASPELAIARVKHRVSTGGHSIPEDVIKRRYFRSMANFINLYRPLADRWILCDNSDYEPTIIAQKYKRLPSIEICNEPVWNQFNRLSS